MNRGGPLVLFTGVQRMARGLRDRGFVAACLRETGEAISSPEDVDIWIPYDPHDLAALEQWADQWTFRDRVVAIVNRRERRVMEHALLNRALGRPGIQPEQARVLRDKLLLRQTLAGPAPHLTPPFAEVHLASPEPPDLPTPFLLKPRNLFKSQLITLCRDPEDWKSARHDLTAKRVATSERHGVPVGDSFVAEAYLEGTEVSMDGLVGHEGEIVFTPSVRVKPAREWGLDDFHVAVRHLPSGLSEPEEARIRDAVREVVRVLDLRYTPLHVDLVLHRGRPVILDVAPRIGGYRSEMMDLAHGAPLDPTTLGLAMGQEVRWESRWHRAVAVAELFPPRPGRLDAIHGLERVRLLRSFHRTRQRIPVGEPVGWARDGFRCPLFVILTHDDPRVVEEEVEGLPGLVDIRVDSPA